MNLIVTFHMQKKRLSLITNSTASENPHTNDLYESYHGSSAKFSLASASASMDGAAALAPFDGAWKSSTLERNKQFSVPKSNAGPDRTNDVVYAATTSVVKAIMALSQGVERAVASDYLDLVRNVGIELRALLSSVDSLAAIFPVQATK